MIRNLALLFLLSIVPVPTFALVIGGTNFGYMGYPVHSCNKPIKPVKPYRFSSDWEVDSYNSQVDSYNNELRQYINCMKEYVESAQNDIKRIEEKNDEAIEEAKRPSI